MLRRSSSSDRPRGIERFRLRTCLILMTFACIGAYLYATGRLAVLQSPDTYLREESVPTFTESTTSGIRSLQPTTKTVYQWNWNGLTLVAVACVSALVGVFAVLLIDEAFAWRKSRMRPAEPQSPFDDSRPDGRVSS